MYEITLNGKTLYHPNSIDCVVSNAVIHEALNDSGYMDITVPHTNPMYNELTERKGKLIVFKNNVECWYGELRDIGKDFSKNKILYVVGEASYLNDSVQPQIEYKDKTKYQVFQSIINNHNSQVEKDRQFQPGIIGTGANSYVHIVTDWEYSLDAIRNHLCGAEEYFRIRHVNGVRYIDIMPLDSYGKKSEQVIAFGENLLDYAEESSGEKIATVCIPLGQQIETEKIEGYTNYLTCESANNGKNYVELPGAVQRLGRITKVVHFNVLNTADALVTAAMNYLKEYQYSKLTLKLSAVDLSMLSTDIDSYFVGDYVRALCEPLEMDSWMPIREKETDILNLANNTIKIGSEGTKSITQQQTENYNEIQYKTELELNSAKNSAVQAALKNASEMINANGENGAVSIRLDKNNKPYEIVICNANTLKESTQAWRWNLSGFGHGTKKAGASEFTWKADVAIKMDGGIVANYITSGVLTAIEINNGNGTFKVTSNGSVTATAGSIAGFNLNTGKTLDGLKTNYFECSSSNGDNSILLGHKTTTGSSIVRIKKKNNNGYSYYSNMDEDGLYVYRAYGSGSADKETEVSCEGVSTNGYIKVKGYDVATQSDLAGFVDEDTYNKAVDTINDNMEDLENDIKSLRSSLSDCASVSSVNAISENLADRISKVSDFASSLFDYVKLLHGIE